MFDAQNKEFWPNFLRALQTEPRSDNKIRGATGISHHVLSIGVDNIGKRIVLITSDQDARTAAMVQRDVQETMPDTHVLVARAVSFSISSIALKVQEQLVHAPSLLPRC